MAADARALLQKQVLKSSSRLSRPVRPLLRMPRPPVVYRVNCSPDHYF